MMEKMQKALILSGFVLTLMVSASAQNAAKATIPFNFNIGDKSYLAGEYTVEKLSGSFSEMLALRDQDGYQKAVINGVRVEPVENNGHSRLLFTKYGDRYFLAQVWVSGTGSGASVQKGRLERELAAVRDHDPEGIVVAMAR